MICIYECEHDKISCRKCLEKAKAEHLTGKYAKKGLKTLRLTGRNEEQAQECLKKSVNSWEFMTEKGRREKYINPDGTFK